MFKIKQSNKQRYKSEIIKRKNNRMMERNKYNGKKN